MKCEVCKKKLKKSLERKYANSKGYVVRVCSKRYADAYNKVVIYGSF